jgi:hypothetical protein
VRIQTTAVGLLLAAVALGACGTEEELPGTSSSHLPLWRQVPDKPPGLRPALPAGRARSFSVAKVAGGLRGPVQAVVRPSEPRRLYVVEQRGTIRGLDPGTGRVDGDPLVDLRRQVMAGGERGLLSALFTGRDELYVLFTRRSDGDTRVVRMRLDDGTSTELLAVDQPYENHKGGTLLEDGRGRIVVGLGDGGSAFDPGQRGQDPTQRLGKLLRFDPRRPERGWETVAVGLRNPWRMSFDPATGLLWVGDVGQDRMEEVDALRLPEDQEDRIPNLGWAAYEAHLPLGRKRLEPGTNLIWPVAGYPHSRDRCSVTGGAVYRGQRIKPLRGRYLFGDFCTGELFSMAATGPPRVRLERARIPGIAAFATDGEGELYGVSVAGALHHFIPDRHGLD